MMPVYPRHQRWVAICIVALLAAARIPASASGGPQAPPPPELETAISTGLAQLNNLLVGGDPDPGAVAALVTSTADTRAATLSVFGDYVSRALQDHEDFYNREELSALVATDQRRLEELFGQRLIRDLVAHLQPSKTDSFQVEGLRVTGDRGTLTLSGAGPQGRVGLVLQLHRRAEGWCLRDVKIDGQWLSRRYRSLYRTILSRDYSLPVLEAQLEGREYVSLDDFSSTAPGQLPSGWGWQSKDDGKAKLYQVQAIGDRHYLAAQDTGSSVILLKYIHWNPREYPILTWCWRATALPPGGNERVNHLNDSAAGLYVLFSRNFLGIPQQIKYVWSSTLPLGTVDRRKKWARPYFFVLESGPEQLGKWSFEQVDLLANFRRVYGDKPKNRSLGIGVLTDGNNTDTHVAADYADLRVWTREALAAGSIDDYCECLEETR